MILTFDIGGKIVKFQIDDERKLWMSSENTNNRWVDYDKLVVESGQSGLSADMAKRHLSCRKCLRTNEEVQYHLIDTVTNDPMLRKLGIKHLGTTW
jgi:hypothetical protein